MYPSTSRSEVTNKVSDSSDLAAWFARLEALFPSQPQQLLLDVEPLIEAADAAGDEYIWGRTVLLKANAYYFLGRLPEAKELLNSTETRIRRRGHPRIMASFLNLRSVEADRHNNYVESIEILREALVHARAHGELPVIANLLGNIGLNLTYLGDHGPALSFLEEALETWRRFGEPPGMIPTLISLGMACQNVGQADLAISYMTEALERSHRANDGRRTCVSLVNLANFYAEQGNFVQSESYAREAMRLTEQGGDIRIRAHAIIATVAGASARGDFETARQALVNGMAIYEEAELPRGIALASMDLADLPTTSKAEAKALNVRAREIARAAKLRALEARACLALAKGAQAEGNWQRALEETETARLLERQLYDEESQLRLQAVRVRQEVDALSKELARERRERDEIARLLDAVEEQKEIAEEASRQKSAILGIAAHDLRNGIAGVIGCLELVLHQLEGKKLGEEVQENLDLAHRAAAEVFGLLLRLLDHSAIERGELSSHPKPTDLRSTAEKFLAKWTRELSAKQQTVKLIGGEDTIIASVDPDRWGQIFTNLLSNAVKYSPREAVIEVVLIDTPPNPLRVEFRDRGPGLSPEDQKRLFRPFQTLEPRPTGGEVATGLGLHIVQGMIENEGGRIGYTPRQGGGSIFWVELPRTSQS